MNPTEEIMVAFRLNKNDYEELKEIAHRYCWDNVNEYAEHVITTRIKEERMK